MDNNLRCHCTSGPCPMQRRITVSRTLGSSKAKQLIAYVQAGDIRGTKRLLKAGAWVNGDEEDVHCPPLVAAALHGQIAIAKILLKAGADIDVAVPRDVRSPGACRHVVIVRGQRALHSAAGRLDAPMVRLLLDSGADVRVADHSGATPLFELCRTSPEGDDPGDSKRVAVARQLLHAGAQLNASDKNGNYPVHYASLSGTTELLDTILWKAPADLDRRSRDGMTPLYVAAMTGNAGTVAHLLSRGAQQPAAYHLECTHGCQHVLECPLREAVSNGHEGVVRIFLDRGMEAIGGMSEVLQTALRYTMPSWRTSILAMLLAAEGSEGARKWANSSSMGVSLLHTAASYNALPNISMLLRAGADEEAVCPTGATPHGAVGYNVDEKSRATGDPEENAAVHRLLAQGPAFRARSFLWPAAATEVDGGGGGGGVVGVAGVWSSRSEGRDVPLRVSVWRPPRRREFLVGLIARLALKGVAAPEENRLVVAEDTAVDGDRMSIP